MSKASLLKLNAWFFLVGLGVVIAGLCRDSGLQRGCFVLLAASFGIEIVFLIARYFRTFRIRR